MMDTNRVRMEHRHELSLAQAGRKGGFTEGVTVSSGESLGESGTKEKEFEESCKLRIDGTVTPPGGPGPS